MITGGGKIIGNGGSFNGERPMLMRFVNCQNICFDGIYEEGSGSWCNHFVLCQNVHTYLEAKAAGDENVYFISGEKLMELVGDNGTVDNCHPTDSGFFSMACAVEEVLKEILNVTCKHYL